MKNIKIVIFIKYLHNEMQHLGSFNGQIRPQKGPKWSKNEKM